LVVHRADLMQRVMHIQSPSNEDRREPAMRGTLKPSGRKGVVSYVIGLDWIGGGLAADSLPTTDSMERQNDAHPVS
jgi:hypothetical protein